MLNGLTVLLSAFEADQFNPYMMMMMMMMMMMIIGPFGQLGLWAPS
jgi:hypothetical protein